MKKYSSGNSQTQNLKVENLSQCMSLIEEWRHQKKRVHKTEARSKDILT